jgi:hypothetical protein
MVFQETPKYISLQECVGGDIEIKGQLEKVSGAVFLRLVSLIYKDYNIYTGHKKHSRNWKVTFRL